MSDISGTAMKRCIGCNRKQKPSRPMKQLGPRGNQWMCDDCNPEVETA